MKRSHRLVPLSLVAVGVLLAGVGCSDADPDPGPTTATSTTQSTPTTQSSGTPATGTSSTIGATGPIRTEPPTFTCSATPDEPRWVPLGEPGNGGWVTEIEFSPFDSDVLLAGGDVMGLVRSVDGGASWRHVEGLLSAEIAQVTWHPSDPEEVWVATLSGPHVSHDAGRTWASARTGMPSLSTAEFTAPVEVVVFDPTDEQRLLAFGGNRRESVLTGDIGLPGTPAWGAVWASSDNGDAWVEIGTLPGVVTDAGFVEPGVLVASVDEAGLYRSDDGGANWVRVGVGLDNPNIRDIEIQSDGRLLVAIDAAVVNGAVTAGSIASSDDGGLTFATVDVGVEPSVGSSTLDTTGFRVIVAAPSDPAVLYTSNVAWQHQAVYRSDDAGATWADVIDEQTATLGPRFYGSTPVANDLSIAADQPQMVAIAGSEYILVSGDAQSWTDATSVVLDTGRSRGTGFSGLVANDVFFSATDPDLKVLMAFDGGNLLVSPDGGTGWTNPLSDIQPYGGGQATAEGPAGQLVTLLGQAGIFAGIGVSGDGGSVWELVAGAGAGLPEDQTQVRLGGIVFVDGAFLLSLGPDLYRSTDGGRTWSASSTGVEFTALSVTGNGTIVGGADSGVFVSGDGGATFAPLEGGPSGVWKVRADPFDPDAVYATSWRSGTEDRGLWRHSGTQWSRLNEEFYAYDLAVDPNVEGRMVMVTDDPPFHDAIESPGVLCSLDNGRTWTAINEGLPLLRVRAAAFDPHRPGRLVVGTNGAGYVVADLGER